MAQTFYLIQNAILYLSREKHFSVFSLAASPICCRVSAILDKCKLHMVLDQVIPPVLCHTEIVWLFWSTTTNRWMIIEHVEQCSSATFLGAYNHKINLHYLPFLSS